MLIGAAMTRSQAVHCAFRNREEITPATAKKSLAR